MPKEDQQARLQNDLKHFLKPYFSFRAYVVFKKTRVRRHFYGNEHRCTWGQVSAGYVPFIELSKEKGYTDLIELIEKKWQGRLESAAIYMREEGQKDFNTLCRRYYLGSIQNCQDPVISQDEQKLFFMFENYNLHLSKEPFIMPDFKREIEENLKHATV